jgi:hypothetical protein
MRAVIDLDREHEHLHDVRDAPLHLDVERLHQFPAFHA